MGCAAGVPVKDAGAPAKAELEVVVPPSPLGKQQSVQKADTGKEFIKITNKQCSQIRLDTSQEVKKIPVTGQMHDFTAHYCYVSQKGYYPNALGKANQDSYLVTEAILGDKSCNLFGIFDGHGEYGDYCSFYAADSFPGHLAYELKTNGGLSALDGAKMQDLYTRAFLNTNFGLHSSKIDDSLSGTTGVTILQRGDKLYVANVGDSRAIIASEVDGKLKYSPLSIDQTPYRKDERERLKRAGAKIMTMDQIEGNEPIHENFGTDLGEEIDEGGDPPRVWDATLEKPGCAFSRSIGDAVAKEVGVTAEPEILEWQLSPKDKFAVVASDGVFEFITSQNVVDMIAKYPNKLEAAKQVVAEAYRLWLTYDDRTDDISIIIICFEDMKVKASQKGAAANAPKGELSRMASLSRGFSSADFKENNKPVRKVMTKNKRKDIAEDWNKEEASVFDFSNIENNKTEEEIARISEMIGSSFMFQNLSPLQKDLIYAVMHLREVKKDEVIIREGDKGDEMYIVDSGSYVVYKKDEGGVDQQIFSYNEPGSAFGELSLMYGKPRGASVIATSKGRLWCIGRAAFRAVMMKGKSEGLLDIYQTIPVINELTLPEIHRLCLASKDVSYEKGELIVEEKNSGNSSWALCIVITGVVSLYPQEEGKKKQLRAELSFISIAEFGTKFKNAIAENKVKLSCIPKSIYHEILGEERSFSLKETVLKKKSKGKRLQAIKSAFALPENLVTRKVKNIEQYVYESPISLIGDNGFCGNFLDNESNALYTVRSYSKSKTLKLKMDKKVVQERNCLVVISNISSRKIGLPTVIATFQDEKWVNIVFKDHFVCDLSLAIQDKAIQDDWKPYYLACIYSAICKVHSLGLIHRLVNSSSLFITKGGTVKLADFRFARRMEGNYCFTICGDPNYFAPEIVTQQGYDYSIDLWAFGCLIYELFEGTTPFGTSETDETTIFRALSGYRNGKINFTSKTTTDAKSLILDILQYDAESRAGYKKEETIKDADFFTGISWDQLESHRGHPIDLSPQVEIQALFDDPLVTPTLHAAFDSF